MPGSRSNQPQDGESRTAHRASNSIAEQVSLALCKLSPVSLLPPFSIKLPVFGFMQKLKVGICWTPSLSGRPPASKLPFPPSPVLSHPCTFHHPTQSLFRSQMSYWGRWREPSVRGFTGCFNHPRAKSTIIYCTFTMSGILPSASYAEYQQMCPREILLFIPHLVSEETSPCNLVICLRFYAKATIWAYQSSSQGGASQYREAE